MNRHRITLWILLAALVAVTAPTFAQPAQEDERDDERYRFVWRLGGGSYLGVQVLPLTEELRQHFGVPEDTGVLVCKVTEGSPAEAAGIQVGDILTGVDGKPIAQPHRLSREIRRKEEGETAEIELWRDGAMMSLPVTIAKSSRSVHSLGGGNYTFIPGFAAERLEDFHFEIDQDTREALEDAMHGLEERLESDEWREKLERWKSLDFSRIQRRMREVEERLKELEKELQEYEKKDEKRI